MRAIPGLVLLLSLVASVASVEAARQKPPPCTGRFVLDGGKIALFTSQAVVSEITLDGGGMMLNASCGFVRGRRRAIRAGWKLKARWKHCVLGNDVRMTARVPAACDRMTGSLVVDLGRLVSRRFTARSCGPLAQDGRGTWDVIREQVIAGRGCTTDACHGSALSGGLDLRGDPYDRLVDVPSSSGTLRRIEPGDQLRSLLWRKVAKATRGTTDDVGPGMPVGLPPLSEDELEALKIWIRNGAPHSGVVPGTAERLGTCLAKADPPTIRPAAPPAPGTGVQLYAPPWRIPANGENEVCYATYYDVRAQVPPALLHPCPAPWGAEKTCFDYRAEELTQSPNSHHSIIHSYVGPSDVTAPGFGPFACRGGPMDGIACNPKGIGVAAPDGADCGTGGGCAGEPQSTVACIGFGPAELAFRAFGLPQIGGSQQPLFRIDYPYGVVATLPVEGIIVWNSHAFNVTDVETTNEEWFNLYFPDSAPEARQYPGAGDIRHDGDLRHAGAAVRVARVLPDVHAAARGAALPAELAHAQARRALPDLGPWHRATVQRDLHHDSVRPVSARSRTAAPADDRVQQPRRGPLRSADGARRDRSRQSDASSSAPSTTTGRPTR